MSRIHNRLVTAKVDITGIQDIQPGRGYITIRIDVEKSNNGILEMKMKKSAYGKNYDNARSIAESITLGYKTSGDTLLVEPWFKAGPNNRWRSQEILLTLMIPEGKVIFLDESLLPVLHNIQNLSDTWKGDMVRMFWKMESEGLKCIQ